MSTDNNIYFKDDNTGRILISTHVFFYEAHFSVPDINNLEHKYYNVQATTKKMMHHYQNMLIFNSLAIIPPLQFHPHLHQSAWVYKVQAIPL